jgi:hypothetical protein
MELAYEVLAGTTENPTRPADDMWYERFHAFKSSTMPPAWPDRPPRQETA